MATECSWEPEKGRLGSDLADTSSIISTSQHEEGMTRKVVSHYLSISERAEFNLNDFLVNATY